MLFFRGQELIFNENVRFPRPQRLDVKSRNDRRAGLLWLEENVQLLTNSCPGSMNSYIYATCPTRAGSKNDCGLGKSKVYDKRANNAQPLRSKGLSKTAHWLEENEGSRQTALQTFDCQTGRATRVVSKYACGSHLATISGNTGLVRHNPCERWSSNRRSQAQSLNLTSSKLELDKFQAPT